MSASTQDLEVTFSAWTEALNRGDLKTFWDFFDEECDILDEDFPWCMNKEDFVDHVKFHASGKGLWESFEWKLREVHFRVIGDTEHIRGFATFGGKLRDAGFRQRFMGFTHTWVRHGVKWKLICWHQGVLLGRIVARHRVKDLTSDSARTTLRSPPKKQGRRARHPYGLRAG